MKPPHSDLVKEWLEDTSRAIQAKPIDATGWYDISIEDVINDKFISVRFKLDKKEVVSSLSEDEINKIHSDVCSFGTSTRARVAIANAAAAQHQEDIIKWLRSRGEAARRIAEELENR